MINMQIIYKELEQAAVNCSTPEVGAPRQLHYLYVGHKSKFHVRCLDQPANIRDRIARLQKDERSARRNMNNACRMPRLPSMKQAKYSKVVAQSFLDSGEQENYQNYMELFN